MPEVGQAPAVWNSETRRKASNDYKNRSHYIYYIYVYMCVYIHIYLCIHVCGCVTTTTIAATDSQLRPIPLHGADTRCEQARLEKVRFLNFNTKTSKNKTPETLHLRTPKSPCQGADVESGRAGIQAFGAGLGHDFAGKEDLPVQAFGPGIHGCNLERRTRCDL